MKEAHNIITLMNILKTKTHLTMYLPNVVISFFEDYTNEKKSTSTKLTNFLLTNDEFQNYLQNYQIDKKINILKTKREIENITNLKNFQNEMKSKTTQSMYLPNVVISFFEDYTDEKKSKSTKLTDFLLTNNEFIKYYKEYTL